MKKVSKVVAFVALVACAAVLPAFAADQPMFGGTTAPVHKKAKKHLKKVVKPMAGMATADKK